MKFDSSGNSDEALHTTVSAKPYIFFIGLRRYAASMQEATVILDSLA